MDALPRAESARNPFVVDPAPKKISRCICPACIARTVLSARKHLARGKLNSPRITLRCSPGACPALTSNVFFAMTTALLWDLHQEVSEYRGRTPAYQAQEHQRFALGNACPCLAKGGR